MTWTRPYAGGWRNDATTPLSNTALNKIDQGLIDAHAALDGRLSDEALNTTIDAAAGPDAAASNVEGYGQAFGPAVQAAVAAGAQAVQRLQKHAGLATWRAALANAKAGTGKAVLAVVGNSKSEGENASPGATFRDVWTRYLLNDLRADWQPAGIAGGVGYIPLKYAVANPTGQGFALTGTVGTDYNVSNSAGPGARHLTLRTATAAATRTEKCTSLEVHYYNTVAGTKIDVTIDGTTTTITTGSTGGAQKWTSGALTSGNHTVTIKKNSTSPADAAVAGVFFYDGDEAAGVQFVDASHYGYKVSDALTTAQQAFASLNLFAPDLVIVKMNTNDMASVNAATFQANLLQMMETGTYSLKNRLTTKVPSYLFVIEEERSGMVSPIGDYAAAVRAVAAAMTAPAAVLDLTRYLPKSATPSALPLWTDGIHEGTYGHRYVANLVGAVVNVLSSSGAAALPTYTSTWNGTTPFKLGGKWVWLDVNNDLRVSSAQPASDTSGILVGAPRVLSSAQLQDATHSINVNGKYQGKQVYCTTLGKPLWTNGSGATATWNDVNGTAVITPA